MSFKAGIYSESERNSKLVTDIDKFKDRYIVSDPINNITVRFPGFDIRTFERNFFILLSKSVKIDFNVRWESRPDYCSYDFYKSTIYWPLLLWLNNVPVIEEFTKELGHIYVPSWESILELTRYKNNDSKLHEYSENEPINNEIIKYYKKYPLNAREINLINSNINLRDTTSSVNIITEIVEREDIFNLDSTNISNKYIDLLEIPNNTSSITLYLNNYSISQRYGYDYTLVANEDDELRRISWLYKDVLENSPGSQIPISAGMRNFIKVGDIIKVKYLTTIVTIG